MIDKMELSIRASRIRKMLGEDESSPIDIFTLAQTIDSLTLVFYPLGPNISGACFNGDVSSVIAVNSEMSLGRQRFSMAHELYHLFFDKDQLSTICPSKTIRGNENEKNAECFASYLLAPPAALREAVQKRKAHAGKPLSLGDLLRLEQHFGMSHQAMLLRLKEEKELSAEEADSMQSGIISAAARLGFDASLYKPSPEHKKIQVLGHYIGMADRLLNAQIISDGKYEELLLDAFRDDIVFGGEEEGSETVD